MRVTFQASDFLSVAEEAWKSCHQMMVEAYRPENLPGVRGLQEGGLTGQMRLRMAADQENLVGAD